jgi:hypothetical protein
MSKLASPNSVAAELPPNLLELLAELPANVDRRVGADLITRYLFPISYRTLEAWPLPTRNVNGKAIVATTALFEHAYRLLQAAPVIIGGRRSVHARLGA